MWYFLFFDSQNIYSFLIRAIQLAEIHTMYKLLLTILALFCISFSHEAASSSSIPAKLLCKVTNLPKVKLKPNEKLLDTFLFELTNEDLSVFSINEDGSKNQNAFARLLLDNVGGAVATGYRRNEVTNEINVVETFFIRANELGKTYNVVTVLSLFNLDDSIRTKMNCFVFEG